MIKYIFYGLAIALIISSGIVVAIPSTDDFSPNNPLWNGLTKFVKYYNTTLITAVDVGKVPKGGVVLILGPSTTFRDDELGVLVDFVGSGGTLIIADDFGTSNQLLSGLGLNYSFTNALLADDLFMYRSPRMPRVRAYLSGRDYELYLNYPTTIDVGSLSSCIALSSPFSYLDLNLDNSKGVEEPYGPFCISYLIKHQLGNIILISDSSIVINAMIDLGGNRAFIDDVVRGREVYVVSDKWVRSTYAVVRDGLVGVLILAYTSNLRYLTILITCLTTYLGIRRLPKAVRVRYVDEVIKEVLERNKGWSLDLLKRLARDLGYE